MSSLSLSMASQNTYFGALKFFDLLCKQSLLIQKQPIFLHHLLHLKLLLFRFVLELIHSKTRD